jgi:hypothetical protein
MPLFKPIIGSHGRRAPVSVSCLSLMEAPLLQLVAGAVRTPF